MRRLDSTYALATAVFGLLLGTACSSSSDGNMLPSGLGGNAANGGAQQGGGGGTPGSGGSGPNTLGSGGSLPSGVGGNVALGGGGSGNSVGGAAVATGGQTPNANVGGTSIGGVAATGGKATNAGGATTGGVATGGKATNAGGATTGGVATGGKATNAGGATTGGVATGGKATGGAATGGAQATGGAATGGKATGGTPATGGASSGTASCNTTLPTATSTKNISSSQPVSGTFDGGMARYCGTGSLGSGGDAEGQDPLFNVANGGTLKNVILGGSGCSAADGVHCAGSCTLENVWWGDVGEDAATFRGGATKVVINGGGAFNATDKVFQDNTTGGDLVTITNFFVSTAGKLYRSCGTCANDDRHVVIQNVAYKSVSQLVGLNTNNGDTAKITGLVDCGGNSTICAAYTWIAEGTDPTRNGTCSY